MLRGDRMALARLMTYVDNRHEDLINIMRAVYPHCGQARKIGMTGPPGSGKSTLVDCLIRYYRKANKKVGVVAIDPSSPFSGGALLGDRIRMVDHNADDKVFIRSLGSRGSRGGLSRATRDVVNLMDAFGMDLILIETVGVGQTELDIMSVADCTIVVLVPESGDTVQTMKAGLLEIADIFVVNKADREGADLIYSELMSLSEGHQHVPVLKTEAVNNKGLEPLAAEVESIVRSKSKGKVLENLLKQECLDILTSELQARAKSVFFHQKKFKKILLDLVSKHHNPYQSATEILEKIHWKELSNTE